ncbi:WxcM-like domain-containing protein [Bacteroides sp. AM07-16]|uniref:sugar 3,4-ketoisomerase n=1 Tax=Parabacteroides bouchesdurhonensis TaxID=1936995 RepID=UPI000E510598|nr:FdtA/QdtA family cupin domain-containing protein [Parabacteroides bouchesdurhonensis]RHJ94183.1 WxcM-like domain-containing protein [Bacteroides sp. AM07-16]
MTVFDCSIIQLPRIENEKGNITPIAGLKNIPFEIKRVFYTYDIPGGEARGAHAHKECHQLLVAASGSFEVVLEDGLNKRTILLNRPFYGLHIPPGIWAAEQGFSSGSICLVLASHKYDENDYIRNYKDFHLFIDMLNNINGGGGRI